MLYVTYNDQLTTVDTSGLQLNRKINSTFQKKKKKNLHSYWTTAQDLFSSFNVGITFGCTISLPFIQRHEDSSETWLSRQVNLNTDII